MIKSNQKKLKLDKRQKKILLAYRQKWESIFLYYDTCSKLDKVVNSLYKSLDLDSPKVIFFSDPSLFFENWFQKKNETKVPLMDIVWSIKKKITNS